MRLDSNFDKALEGKPKLLYEQILRMISQEYIMPMKMMLAIDTILDRDFGINQWKLVIAPEYYISPKEHKSTINHLISKFEQVVQVSEVDIKGKPDFRKKRRSK